MILIAHLILKFKKHRGTQMIALLLSLAVANVHASALPFAQCESKHAKDYAGIDKYTPYSPEDITEEELNFPFKRDENISLEEAKKRRADELNRGDNGGKRTSLGHKDAKLVITNSNVTLTVSDASHFDQTLSIGSCEDLKTRKIKSAEDILKMNPNDPYQKQRIADLKQVIADIGCTVKSQNDKTIKGYFSFQTLPHQGKTHYAQLQVKKINGPADRLEINAGARFLDCR
jgi:hypothetical protein